MLTSHLTVLRDFWPLFMLAIVGAVLATAYYWATKPGELLSFWATWVNKQYAIRTLLYETPIPGKKGDIIVLSGQDYDTWFAAVGAMWQGDFVPIRSFGLDVTPNNTGGYEVTYNEVEQHFIDRMAFSQYLARLYDSKLTYVDSDANAKRNEKYQWVLKPILTCERCIGGQFGFWLSVLAILNGAYLSLLSVLFVVALTSLLSSLIVKEFNR